jgi:CelD/BcsL family acetyltransferase involved in cellulose biosynthesis
MQESLTNALSRPEPPSSRLVASAIDDLDALEPDWWDLWRRAPTATPFQSPAWLIPWRREFAPERSCVGGVFDEPKLVALFPFYAEQSAASARLLPLGVSLSDYLDILVDPRCPEALRALAAFIADQAWTSCSFEELPPGALAAALPAPSNCEDRVERQSACPVIALRGGRDLAGCAPARKRRQLRRAWAAAERLGEARIERREQDSERFLATLFALHEARWRERGEGGVLGDAKVRRFHQAALPRLAAADLARCYTLAIDGQPVAAYYGLFDRGRAYAYLGGFDPAFEDASPGAILIGRAIADAIDEGAREFHFLRGREAYKYSWGASDRWNQRRLWTRPDHGR